MIPLEQVKAEYMADRATFDSKYRTEVFVYQPRIEQGETPDDRGPTVQAKFDLRKGYSLSHRVPLVIPIKHKPTSLFGIITLGRMDTNDIVVDSEHVSRFHASFTRLDSGVLMTDKGSKNGTYVNREPLKKGEPRKLNNMDAVQLGGLESKVEFTYYTHDGLRTYMEYLLSQQPVGNA